ncbi:hypothetical protein TI05_04425 [Achromatium sp. WMS3]|nr:hypothetical protein TI05_04425 [Achromatium sp. WMS3]
MTTKWEGHPSVLYHVHTWFFCIIFFISGLFISLASDLGPLLGYNHFGPFIDGNLQQFFLGQTLASLVENGNFWSVLGIFLLLLSLIMMFSELVRRKSHVFTLTNSKVITKHGIFSRKTNEVAICDIRMISVRQGMIERLFSLGTIQIGSAATALIELEFTGIRHPEMVKGKINQTRADVCGNFKHT